jgi:hypothetical protein
MSEIGPEELLALRVKLTELEFKAKSDPSLLSSLQSEPAETLRAEGFSDVDAESIAPRLGSEMMPPRCDPLTCIVTMCSFWTS